MPGARAVEALLAELMASGTASAAVARIVSPAGIVEAAAGEASGPAAWFDLGSLTKLFTATLALVLDGQGTLPLATRVGEIFPEAHPELAAKSLDDLLRHRGGLPPWYPFYAVCEEPEEVLAPLLAGDPGAEPADPAPPGTYSDLDFLLYGFAAEKVAGQSLHALLRRQLFEPLDLTRVAPSPGRLPDLVPCRLDNGREVELAAALGHAVKPVEAPPAGIVQDGNARFFGGLAAHAGLFAAAADLAALACEWLHPGRLLSPPQVARALAGEGPFALGWRRWSGTGSAAPLSPRSFGHTGFPGGSLWLDLERRSVFVLLAHKTASAVDLTPWRRRFHALGAGGSRGAG